MSQASDSTLTTLARLKVGERGRVAEISGGDSLAQRLREMGLLEGEVVQVTRVAPLGDPIAIRCGDFTLSVRKAEAERARVEKL
jgi:ferrous iron transport protein A